MAREIVPNDPEAMEEAKSTYRRYAPYTNFAPNAAYRTAALPVVSSTEWRVFARFLNMRRGQMNVSLNRRNVLCMLAQIILCGGSKMRRSGFPYTTMVYRGR